MGRRGSPDSCAVLKGTGLKESGNGNMVLEMGEQPLLPSITYCPALASWTRENGGSNSINIFSEPVQDGPSESSRGDSM